MNEPRSSRSPEQQLLLKRIRRALTEVVDAVAVVRGSTARSQNVHPTDFACIDYLQRVGQPVSPKQIIAHLNISSGSGTALLDRLEAAGYTRRLPNPDDRRSILIELDTEKAAEPLARLREIEQSYWAVTGSFSTGELQAIARFMEEMENIAKKLS